MIRFFTTLALRHGEEVDGSLVPHLPRAATVELADGAPVTAVWHDDHGGRRIAWYGRDLAAIRRDHAERHGDEPFWVIDRALPGELDVTEHDGRGAIVARRRWTFDHHGQPLTEDERDAAGAPVVARRYQCLRGGLVVRARERRAGAASEQPMPRPRTAVAPALAAEPFPCGGTTGGAVRLLDSLGDNELQGRARAVWWSGEAWLPAISSWTVVADRAGALARPVLDHGDPLLGRLVGEGVVSHPHRASWEPPVTAITELRPAGETVQDLVASGPLPAAAALRLALDVGRVALRAQARGVALGAIRPELVYVGAGGALSGLLHRAPALFAATRRGETPLWPPVFRADFSSPDDVAGLAQLLWFMTTGGHPYLAPADVTWHDGWTALRHEARSPQPWRGPAALGDVLERCLFRPARPDLAAVVAELSSLVA